MSEVTQPRSSLVVQWLRICPPVQGTQVRFLVGKPRSHMPWGDYAHTPQPLTLCTAIKTQHSRKQANPKKSSHTARKQRSGLPFCLTMAGKRKLRAGVRAILCMDLWWGASWGPCRWESGVTVPPSFSLGTWVFLAPAKSLLVSPLCPFGLELPCPPRPSLLAQLSLVLDLWSPASLHSYLILLHLFFCTYIS